MCISKGDYEFQQEKMQGADILGAGSISKTQ